MWNETDTMNGQALRKATETSCTVLDVDTDLSDVRTE